MPAPADPALFAACELLSKDPATLYEHAGGELLDEMSDELAKEALVPGKSVVISDVWWRIISRDLKDDAVELAMSEWSLKDGFPKQPNKKMAFSTLVGQVKAGKIGVTTKAGKHYGPRQDEKVRDAVRKKNGLPAAPGMGAHREKAEA